jgi:hypothetical protein
MANERFPRRYYKDLFTSCPKVGAFEACTMGVGTDRKHDPPWECQGDWVKIPTKSL